MQKVATSEQIQVWIDQWIAGHNVSREYVISIHMQSFFLSSTLDSIYLQCVGQAKPEQNVWDTLPNTWEKVIEQYILRGTTDQADLWDYLDFVRSDSRALFRNQESALGDIQAIR